MVLLFMLSVFSLLCFIFLLFYLISFKKLNEMEVISPYECGFEILSQTRMLFSYRFFLISILFLIFDVEIVLLLIIPFLKMSIMGMYIFIGFMLILIVGFFYEILYGSLEWL